MEWWQHLTLAAWRLLDQHGLLAAFVFILVEEAGTPIPIPGDLVMVLVGSRAAQGRLGLVEVLVVMELATLIGTTGLYWISARAGRRVIYRLGRHVGLTGPRLDQIGAELNRRGSAAVILGRLTPGLRIATPIACGLFRFPFRVFLPALAFGAFLYLAFYTLLGYFFGPFILRLLETFELPLGLIASGALLAALAFWTARVGKLARPAEREPELRERLWAGAASGLIATLQSALLANVLINLFGLLAFRAPGAALTRLGLLLSFEAGRSPGIAAASLLIPALLVVGAALGAIYGAWIGRARHSGGPWHGAAFALLPLAASLFLALPLLGAGFAGVGLGAGLVPAAGETVRHLCFGLVLGTLYRGLARSRRSRPGVAPGTLEPESSLAEATP